MRTHRTAFLFPSVALVLLLAACTVQGSFSFTLTTPTSSPDAVLATVSPVPAVNLIDTTAKPPVHTTVVLDGLIGPVGLAALADGTLLIAEEGTGANDESAGVTMLTPDGVSGRLITGLPSSRDAGDLAGVHLVSVAPDGKTLYIGSFGQGYLWQYLLDGPLTLPTEPLLPNQLGQALLPLNNVRLVNPFAMTYAADGRPVVTDASGNGVATLNPDGTIRFIHRFEMLANPLRASDPIEAVPTGIERVGDEYYVTLFGGCPYPAKSGQLVAIDEVRNQRTVVDGLDLPIDVARGVDGTIWVLEFARFTPGASCFDGSGYQPRSGRLSRLLPDGRLQMVVDALDFPGALLPMPDGSLYLSEVFGGRVLHIVFDDTAPSLMDSAAVIRQPTAAAVVAPSAMPSVTVPLLPLSLATPANPAAEPPAADTQSLYFTNVADQAGLAFRHGAFRNGLSMDPAAAMGAGLCWIDYDNDGWLDLYLVNSHAADEVAYWQANGGLPHNALYRNQGGTFVEVSRAAGVDLAVRGNGCVAADLNLDGWSDLLITADGPNLLLWNQGDGTFREGADAAGLAAPEWNSAAVVGDLNRDGLPDLFVAAYIDLTKMIPKPSGAFPQDFYGLPDRLYLNQGIDPATGYASFREVTTVAGLTRAERGLGALLTDVDQDGDLDLYIANDGHPNRLYRNVPWPGGLLADPEGLGFRFEDATAAADVGDSGSGMGVAGGDFDGDARLDLLITNWDSELNALYANRTDSPDALDFQYSTFRIGMAGFGAGLTGWGVQMADFDHDSDDDLLIANGHVPITDVAVDAEPVRFYRNRTQELLVNPDSFSGPPRLFRDASAEVGLDAVGMLMARGSAAADYDNDGDLDVAINTVRGNVVLLENNAADQRLGNWIQFDVAGFQPGMRILLTLPDGRQLLREQHVGSSYLAGEDPRFHFGLGTVTVVPQVALYWPDGTQRTLEAIAVNQTVPITR